MHPADQLAIEALHAELGYVSDGPLRFRVRLFGATGSFLVAAPLAVAALAVVTAALASLPLGGVLAVIAASLVYPAAGRVHGLSVGEGRLTLDGVDLQVPLEHIHAVRRTVTGLSIERRDAPSVALQLTQREAALDWLAERIREAIIAHGRPTDVPAELARLRGEGTGELDA